MTSIAYRDGVLAADTSGWQEDICVYHANKIYRLKDGRLFTASGRVPAVDCCLEWLNGKHAKPEPAEKNEFGGILLSKEGLFRISYKFEIYRDLAEFSTEGCHGELMRGAMLMGATAAQAVELAIKYGAFAHGEVQAERL